MSRHIKISEDFQRLTWEIILRIIFFVAYVWTDDLKPFHRTLQPEELWLYRFPQTPSYYTVRSLYMSQIFASCFIIGIFYIVRRDVEDAVQAILGACLVFGLCGLVTNIIKIAVGRPRPDFLQRCFPNEDNRSYDFILNPLIHCKRAKEEVIDEGLKSFPSGHSSHAMSGLGYLCLYVAGKFRIFSSKGQSSAWQLTLVAALFLWPVLIGISRTADYHHHWQDVVAGLVLGFTVAYIVYFHSYPPLNHTYSHLPYTTHGHRDTVVDLEKGFHHSKTVVPDLKLV